MKVRMLVPGDEIYDLVVRDKHMFIGSSTHPKYPGLLLVIWLLADGSWSLDALDPNQDVGDVASGTELDSLERLKDRLNV